MIHTKQRNSRSPLSDGGGDAFRPPVRFRTCHCFARGNPRATTSGPIAWQTNEAFSLPEKNSPAVLQVCKYGRVSDLEICASDHDRAIILEPSVYDELGRYRLNPSSIGSEGRQWIVVVCAEMIRKRLNGHSAVDAFAVDPCTEPDDLPPVVVIPFVGGKSNGRLVHMPNESLRGGSGSLERFRRRTH